MQSFRHLGQVHIMINGFLEYFEGKDFFELFSGTIFPAPAAAEPMVDFEDQSLKSIIENLSSDELWRVANSFFKRRELKLAQKYYTVLSKKSGNNEKVLALLGLCCILQGDRQSGIRYLKKSIVKDPNLEEARLWLLYALICESGSARLSKHFERLLVSKSSKIKSLSQYLKCFYFAKRGKEKEFQNLYQEILKESEPQFIKELLVLYEFFKGCEALNKGDLVKASAIWAAAYRDYRDQWLRQPIVSMHFGLFSKKKVYFLDFRKSENQFYELVLEKLLHLSLIPEFYESRDAVFERREYWKSQTVGKGTYPYAYFRYALCLLFENKLSDSYEAFLTCRDKIPASKIDYFKIDPLIDWIRDLTFGSDQLLKTNQEAEEESKTGWVESDKNDELLKNGWNSYFRLRKDAEEWFTCGFADPVVAKRWSNLGASPNEAIGWNKAFSTCPLTAFGFFAAGFRDPVEAFHWSREFSVPIEAWECYSAGGKSTMLKKE